MNFLIPANSKRSMLIFGVFNKFDLILFGCGLVISFILLLSLPLQNVWVAVLAIAPGLVTGFLVLPIPNYHNMLTLLKSIIEFYTNRQKFIWKGWCYYSVKEKKRNKK